MSPRCVALLGRRDQPTDAVEEYCRYLGNALQAHGVQLDIKRISWADTGWAKALRNLQEAVAKQKVFWFFLQYTALAWSRRGFSWRFLKVLRLLKKNGARCAVVFHDVEAYHGNRLIDRLRRAAQLRTMREALRLGDLAIFTVPLQKITWLSGSFHNATFIPVGANLPSPERAWKPLGAKREGVPKVGVFSITGGIVAEEVALIAGAASLVAEKTGPIQLAIFGRNALLCEHLLRERLQGTSVELVVQGILSPQEIVELLGSCDALLFQRGPISSRRGSAIAGIACGLPVIGCEGSETASPITEAGVVLLPPGATHEFGPALLRVLTDHPYRGELADRSRQAQINHFSWPAIAASYVEALRNFDSRR